MIRKIFLTAALFASIGAQAQSYQEKARQYIQQYQSWAQDEQRRSGVPAAITLGQGILETSAGESELATKANNHFGIKCKKAWTGETFAHDDDAPQECFRKYPSAYESYRDHSDYLKNSPRYASCFALKTTDYQGWARELRKCGYATNPRYSQQLVKIIEDFQLQDHTYAALGAPANNTLIASAASPAAATLMAEKNPAAGGGNDTPVQSTEQKPVYGELTKKDGIRGFYAQKGDVLLEYAIRYKVRYARLLELNGLADAPLNKDQFVAIESGNRLIQIISHDGSKPVPATTPEKTFTTASKNTTPAPEVTGATASSAAPVSKPVVAASNAAPAATPQKTVPPPAPASAPAPAATPTVASAPVNKPAPAAPQKTNVAPAPPAEKPFNIADEVAIDDRRARYIPPSERNYPPTTSNRTPVSSSTSPANTSAVPPAPQPAVKAPVKAPAPVQKQAAAAAENVQEDDEEDVKTASSKNQKEDEDDEEDDDETSTNPPAKTNGASSEFDKMKARFDKVVYAPSAAKTTTSAPTQSSAPANTFSSAKPTVATVPVTAQASVTAAPQAASGAQYHTVKNGETAYGIAKKYGISMKELMCLNNLNFEAIRVGQKLRVK